MSLRSPLISVVIPCYGHAVILPKAIDSALGQVGVEFEVVVVNDGSPDDTRGVALAYGSSITYVEQSNAGLSAARNLGILNSAGAWLLFLDADDELAPGCLAAYASAIEARPDVGVLHCLARVVNGAGSEVETFGTTNIGEDPVHRLMRSNPGPPNTYLVRRNLLAAAGLFREQAPGCEDWDMWLRLATSGATFSFVEGAWVLYRDLPGSMSKNIEKMMRSARWVVMNAGARHGWCPSCVSAKRLHLREAAAAAVPRIVRRSGKISLGSLLQLGFFLLRNPTVAFWYVQRRVAHRNG